MVIQRSGRSHQAGNVIGVGFPKPQQLVREIPPFHDFLPNTVSRLACAIPDVHYTTTSSGSHPSFAGEQCYQAAGSSVWRFVIMFWSAMKHTLSGCSLTPSGLTVARLPTTGHKGSLGHKYTASWAHMAPGHKLQSTC